VRGFGADDTIEWRPALAWVLGWLAFHLFVALPFLLLCAWLAAQEIAGAPEDTWPAYLFFLGAFATLILGGLTLAMLASVMALARLLIDRQPILRADRHGIEVRAPLRPTRIVQWRDVRSLEIERTRKHGRYTYILNHILVRLSDDAAPELSIKPQMAGHSLEDAHAKLNALFARFR